MDETTRTVADLIKRLQEAIEQLQHLPQDMKVAWGERGYEAYTQPGNPVEMYVDAVPQGQLYLYWGANTNWYEEPQLLIRPSEFERIFKDLPNE